MTRVTLGISPCPNDTFAFAGLLTGAVHADALELEFAIDDVQALNERFARGALDASKASFAAALLFEDALVLRAGSALGFGVGPLLLARPGAPALERGSGARVLCPGARTTAALLFAFFHAGEGRVEHALFSSILPALAAGSADYGVCIHEGRFVYERFGLALVEDLGTSWERATRSPLPLGGIVARRSLGDDGLARLDAAIVASLDWARAHPDAALRVMREHAAELDEAVLWKHVELYVNAWTRDLGSEGEAALATFARLARERGLAGADARLDVRRSR